MIEGIEDKQGISRICKKTFKTLAEIILKPRKIDREFLAECTIHKAFVAVSDNIDTAEGENELCSGLKAPRNAMGTPRDISKNAVSAIRLKAMQASSMGLPRVDI